ncbi:ankyrin repeat-containing domain protein [Dactylonectria macrodidyma]|uniref:Ankyrin repeat-containing domain protein n=1 Tax=Dactylonectria macrodidyma TaxID=307937 RepID=A0A9P9FKT7_9HYPO|nr:ankyrin repeat-containing domain protein [Dactylonectria macrodidyma]
MDPISIAASIAGLVSLADVVFRATSKYVKAVRRSRQDVEDLLGEVKTVSLLLHNLSLVAFELETESTSSATLDQQSHNVKPHHLQGCQKLLGRLEKGLIRTSTGLESTSSLKRVNSSLKWPFSSAETKEMLQEIQRHNQTISLALAADSMSSLRKCLSRQEETTDRVKDLQVTAKKLLDIEMRIHLDERKRRVLQLFSKVNPRSEFETAKRLRHPLTGLWFTESPEFNEWYSTPNAKIWLSGIPGAGKSVIAGTIIDECLQRTRKNRQTAVAYFFCTYRDPKTHLSSVILSSLAAQLAQQSESAFKVLAEYYEELQPDHQLSADPVADELIEVICEICTSFSQVYLIIDGLDECGNQVEASLRDLLDLAMTETHEIINIAVLSRDEAPIRHQLEEGFDCIEMEAHTDDIQLYVAEELEARIASRKLRLRSLELKDHIMARLISGAKGMFRWVACQLDHICGLPTDKDRREALEKLPPTLPSSYERILMRLEDSSEVVRDLVRKTLLIISVTQVQKLVFEEICEALSISDDSDTLSDEDMVEKYEVLQWCGSLVRTSYEGKVVEFAHYTVQEFLEQVCPAHPKLKDYAISDGKACDLLGSLCLRYLTLTNFSRVPAATPNEMYHITRKNEAHPLYEYATVHWLYFVRNSSNQSRISQPLEQLFQTEKTAHFCSWTIQMIHQYFSKWATLFNLPATHFERGSDVAMTIISAVMRPDFTPLHMAAVLGLPDLCALLLEKGANVNMRSKFGTPLHCAIGSFTIFSDQKDPRHFESIVKGEWRKDFIPQTARRMTVQLLIEAGANTGMQSSTPFRSSTVLSLPLLSSQRRPDLEIAIDLLKAGVPVEEEDSQVFEGLFSSWSRDTPESLKADFDGGVVFSNLLLALGESKLKTSAQSRLFTSTLRFMNEKKMETKGLSSEVLPGYDASDDEICAFITSAIKRNDVPTLELFLGSSRSGRVKSGGLDASNSDPDWSSLHIAISAGSLDVLELLLSSGCDPNHPAEDGRTPVHLCCKDVHEDALRMLLRHNASTVIRDKNLKTIWHRSAETNSARILKILTELEEKDQALQMVSCKHETPIATALTLRCWEATLCLLQHCNSKEFWKSGKSIFRAAAWLGSSEVIQKLIDIGIEVDGTDEHQGSPLHFLCPNPSVDCVRLLMGQFPLNQRRQEDSRTPFELMLSLAAPTEEGLHVDVYETVISDASICSTPHDATSLWSYIGLRIMPRAIFSQDERAWLSNMLSLLIHRGVPKLYEETTKRSAILPLISGVLHDIKERIAILTTNTSPPRYIFQWTWISEIATQIVRETKFWSTAVNDSSILGLLLESIVHQDGEMTALLLKSGVDPHARVEQLSALELASLPSVEMSESNFKHLLEYCRADKICQPNEAFQGQTSLHFTAGSPYFRGAVSKLKCLLQTGVDVNAQTYGDCETLLLHHFDCSSFDTLEVLLSSGADPWVAGRDSFDAPLRAVKSGNLSLLAMIEAAVKEKSLPPAWDRTWNAVWYGKLFSGGNALHLAAAFGQAECLEFYINQGLLSYLEATDDDYETPMHYAARFGMSGMIDFLHRLGADLNATSRYGFTPLHLATVMQQLDATQTLVRLGSKQLPCASGCVPLVYAYRTRNLGIVAALESSPGCGQSGSSMTNPKGLRIMADILSDAIRRNDITASRSIISLGCPIDIELNDPPGTSPLMVAINEQKSLEIVEFLLQNGALISTVGPGEFSTALEAAAARPAFNTLLSSLTTQYFNEGGEFLNLQRNPLHVAATYENLAGLHILLDVLCQRDFGGGRVMAQKLDTAGSESSLIAAIINQKDFIHENAALLHQAAIRNNVRLTKVLIDNMANIEPMDNKGNTPLHLAALHGSTDVAKLLLDHGANPNILNDHETTPFMIASASGAWEMVQLLSRTGVQGIITGYWEHTPLAYMLCRQANFPHCNPDARIFHLLLDKGADLDEENLSGQTAIHHLLCNPSLVHLRLLLDKDARLLVPKTKWSRSHFGGYSHPSMNLIAATRNFRILSHYLDKKELQQTSDLAISGKHSLLCTAACWGVVEALQNFIAVGAHLEHTCDEHGTLLEAAASYRKIEAVKSLIRQGSQSNFAGGNGSAAKGITVADCGWAIMHWLLVTRYTEQPKIGHTAWSEEGKGISNWAGFSTVNVPLKWEWRKRRDETMLEYAKRRKGIISKLEGTVLIAS